MKMRKEKFSGELRPFFAGSDVPYCDERSEFVVLRGADETVLAAGMTWKNEFHPMRRYLYVSTAQEYRRKGYASAVYCALQMLYPNEKWQAMIDSDNEAAAQWLSHMGFECVRKCYIADVTCAEMKERPTQQMELTPFAELTQEQAEYLLAMLQADYARKHERINPLKEEGGEALFFASVLDGLDRKGSVCLIENGRIMAYICCYEGEDQYTREVGYVGGRIEDREKYRQFLLNFADQSFETIGGLLIEADNCDEDAMELLSLFDVLPDYSYDTYTTP